MRPCETSQKRAIWHINDIPRINADEKNSYSYPSSSLKLWDFFGFLVKFFINLTTYIRYIVGESKLKIWLCFFQFLILFKGKRPQNDLTSYWLCLYKILLRFWEVFYLFIFSEFWEVLPIKSNFVRSLTSPKKLNHQMSRNLLKAY